MAARLYALVVLLCTLALTAPPALTSRPALAAPAEPAGESASGRWIVQLADPPLASYRGGPPSYAVQSLPQQARGRLDMASAASQQYLAGLQRRQATLLATIQAIFPTAALKRQYQVVFNGMALSLPGADAAALARLRRLPGILAVYPDRVRERQMFSSIPQIGADALWASPAIGGQANAGSGIKIAIIDEGIKAANPFFNPAGYSYPEGFPKGETQFTTPKVIVARSFYNPEFPPLPGNETPEPGPDDSSHGTHVAGTAAGDAGTTATLGTLQLTISGVAPRAYLMNYKALYTNQLFSGGGFDVELIAALEAAVADGADVINNSWGGLATKNPRADPIAQAADAAVDAGVVVVFAAGNAGPNQSTAGSPGFSDKVIAVGASTNPQTVAPGVVDVLAPDGVPAALRDKEFGLPVFGPPLTGTLVGPLPYLPVAEAGGSTLACEPLPAGSLTGKIAVIERGICPFSLKVFNAQQGGAAAAIIYNSEAGGEEVIGMAAGASANLVTIPSAFVARSVGVGMADWYGQHKDAVLVQIDSRPRVVASVADTVVEASSRGPSFQLSLKPDVVAPGFNILSAGFASAEGAAKHLGFGTVSGTSMASPHVAGVAALLRQAHPDWSPADIKSALMSTAVTDLWLDRERTRPAGVLDRGAGRIAADRAASPGLLFDRPALAFGALAASLDQPTRAALTTSARNVSGETQSYTVAAQASGGASVAVSPATFTLAPGASVQLSVAIEIPAGAAAGDYTGQVTLDGGPQQLHLPVWARTLPAEKGAKVLLLDNDGSSSLGLPDYAGYYGNLLSEQNISFHYLDLDAQAGQPQTLPGLQELQRYEIVLWFTGDNPLPSGALPAPTPLTANDQDLLVAYLQGGGSLIASGQDLASASGVGGLFVGYLGAIPVQTNVFTETKSSERRVVGSGTQPWLNGVALDLAPLGKQQPGEATSAGNQTSVDEIAIDTNPDGSLVDPYAIPLLRAESPSAQAGGLVGLARAAEPTLEQPELGIPFRSTYLSFGLEGVRGDTSTTTRKELLQQILYWTVDRPSVALTAQGAQAGQEVAFTAAAQSNTPTRFTRYRWDFGDGTPLLETSEPTARHSYAAAGSYTARVEATNEWGHRALGGVSVASGAQEPTPAAALTAFRSIGYR